MHGLKVLSIIVDETARVNEMADGWMDKHTGGEKIGCQCRTKPADATKITDWAVQDEVYT